MLPEKTQYILDQALKVLSGDTPGGEIDLSPAGHSERLMEVPWAAQWFTPNARLLDIGFTMSSLDWLGLLLAAAREMGVEIQAADIVKPERVLSRYPEDWRDQIQDVAIAIGDIRTLDLPENHFDMVTCISTIEHIGFDEASVDDPNSAFKREETADDAPSHRSPTVDAEVMAAFRRSLKPGGRVVMTVPMGAGGPTLIQDSMGLYARYWEYEAESWHNLTHQPGFNVTEERFFAFGTDTCWSEVDGPADLTSHSSEMQPHAHGCALVLMTRDD